MKKGTGRGKGRESLGRGCSAHRAHTTLGESLWAGWDAHWCGDHHSSAPMGTLALIHFH